MPDAGRGIVLAHVAGVPVAHPYPALGICPNPARALLLGGRLDDGGCAAFGIDLRDMAAGKRGVIDIPGRRRRDAVGPPAARRFPDLHLTRGRFQAAVYAVLPGKPQPALLIESRRVQIGIGALLRQRPRFDVPAFGVVADDGIQSPIGNPGSTIRPDDHAMRRGILAEWNFLHLACRGLQYPQLSGALRRVVDRAIGFRRGGDVMRMRAFGDREITDGFGEGVGDENANKCREQQKPNAFQSGHEWLLN